MAWVAACAGRPLVADGPDAPDGRPLRLVDGLLYLERYWRQEELVRTELAARADIVCTDTRVWSTSNDCVPAWRGCSATRTTPASTGSGSPQRSPRFGRVTVLAGGPGTGKTTTVAQILALLRDRPGAPPRIALAAPTGKAAARLQEAVREAGDVDDLPTASTCTASSGWQPGRSRFRHDRFDRLPYDVIVVDETSMVSLTLMARLLDAVRPDARLVLVGDPDQLASVEAGAVLGDLARAPGCPDRTSTPPSPRWACRPVSSTGS